MASPLPSPRYHRPMSLNFTMGDVPGDPPTPTSRSSMTAPFMPPIAEDEVGGVGIQRVPTIPRRHRSYVSHQPPPVWPRTPLRVPQKSRRRSGPPPPPQRPGHWAIPPQGPPQGLPQGPPQVPAQSVPPPALSRVPLAPDTAAGSVAALQPAATSPPPYVPATYFPPKYVSDGETTDTDSDYNEYKASTGSQSPRLSSIEAEKLEERNMESERSRRRRRSWLLMAALVLLGIGIAVALAVGLTLGLRDKSSSSGPSPNDDSSAESIPIFPAGSFSLEASLWHSSSECTSDPSTWQCRPYASDTNSTTFNLTIRGGDGGSTPYTVSAPETPLAPSFSNVTAALIDAGGADERLVFEFDLDRTLKPQDKDETSRAAECTFGQTKFQATLWTRRGGSGEDNYQGDDVRPWPKDARIVQSKASDLGKLECEDQHGNALADVQAGAGECTCDYANFDLED